ncbi:MAG: hypothetical protein L3J21_11090 [Devosiaceae bacterium]|nr:hypothetical protein [Devosiaceae bacterium]
MNKNNHLLNTSISKTQSIRKILIGVVSAGTMMTGGVSSAVAFDGVIDETIRTISCIGLLITDPELHLVECGTSDTSGSESLAPLIFVKPAPVAPPPALVCGEGEESHDHECVPYDS